MHVTLSSLSPVRGRGLPAGRARWALLAFALWLLPQLAAAPAYHVLTPAAPARAPLPEKKRVPAGWPAFAVGTEQPVTLRLAGTQPQGAAWLRLTTALDDRAPRLIEVRIAGPAPRKVGVLDLRFAHAIEIFQLALPADDVRAAVEHGLDVRLLTAGEPLWFFGVAETGATGPALPVEFQPHLMTATGNEDRRAEFRQRVGSLASLQPFGWMEGCVLDGLHALGRQPGGERFRAAAEAHWRIFLPQRDQLVYEDPRSQPCDNRIPGIEEGLPFADLARRDPQSPGVEIFLAFARKRLRADGAIQDGGTLSAEGSYTIGYALATIAAVRGDAELAGIAQKQLSLRAERLWHDGAIWLRRMNNDRRTFRGWARGVCWHSLGVARSIEPLRKLGPTKELEAELQRFAQWIVPLQRADGLWACFVEEGEKGVPDTSGSAGIATALAIGRRLGVLPPEAGAAAQRAAAGIAKHLTPDGLLGGVAQSNRGGEELQRSDYRVLSQMGMGLYAQLLAETRL